MTSTSDNECPICLEQITPIDDTYTLTIPCNHHYHEECIKSWTQLSASTCPQCRIEIKYLQNVNNGTISEVSMKEADKLSNMIVPPRDRTTTISTHRMEPNVTNVRGDGRNERRDLHLTGQQCCICDNSVLINQIIVCPQCSALYHRSCSDGLNCPLCEEWIDDVTSPVVSINTHNSDGEIKRRRTRRLGLGLNVVNALKRGDKDGEYYTKLVDEMHIRENAALNESQNKGIVEEEAWTALEQLKKAEREESRIPSEPPVLPFLTTSDTSQDKKLKRPKCKSKPISTVKLETGPLKLTASALARLDGKFHSPHSNKSPKAIHSSTRTQLQIPIKSKRVQKTNHETLPKTSELSYTQKLVIQRIILKPHLTKMKITEILTFDSYTELNKNVSHQLYGKISGNEIAISFMNAVIELAEREGFLPFDNRKRVDEFNSAHSGNSIVQRFAKCQWEEDSGASRMIQLLIEREVARLMR